MKNPMELPNKKYESDEMAQQKELVEFVKKNNISADEFSEAYLIALGSPPEASPEKPLREQVYALAKMIDDFMAKGFAADKIGSLIRTKKDYESSSLNYDAMVDKMPISDKERKVLKNIVERKRQGLLTVLDGPTEIALAEINIPEDIIEGEYSNNDLAAMLIPRLHLYENQKIKITFAEA